jgi:hypothetical protein
MWPSRTRNLKNVRSAEIFRAIVRAVQPAWWASTTKRRAAYRSQRAQANGGRAATPYVTRTKCAKSRS